MRRRASRSPKDGTGRSSPAVGVLTKHLTEYSSLAKRLIFTEATRSRCATTSSRGGTADTERYCSGCDRASHRVCEVYLDGAPIGAAPGVFQFVEPGARRVTMPEKAA